MPITDPRRFGFPKAELHVHLEGSAEPRTVCDLNPAVTLEEVTRRYQYSDFAGFIEAYKWVVTMLDRPSHYVLLTERLLASMAAQGVEYAEINLSVGVMMWRGLDVAAIFDAISETALGSSVKTRWIFDAVRQFGAEAAEGVAREAAARASLDVVGFGIGGDESKIAAREFRRAFDIARDAGLHSLPHAGETTDARSVWDAIRELGAERIGHGIRAADDPALLAYLRDHRIPLEISISSNVATGAVASLAEHPVRRIFDAGVPIVLNSDDPAMFHTSINREYEIAAESFGFTGAELAALAAESFKWAADNLSARAGA